MADADFYDRMYDYTVKCPEHPRAQVVEDHKQGDQICTSCGLVLNRMIDTGSEWRTHSSDKGGADPSRVGGTEIRFLNGADLGTMITGGKGEAAFDENGAPKYQNRRKSVQSGDDKGFLTAKNEIQQIAGHIGLNKPVVELAISYFQKVHEQENLKTKGRPIAYGVACIYAACRNENVPRTFKEICDASKVPKKEIGKCFKIVQTVLDTPATAVKNEDFIIRFCENLKLPKTVMEATTNIVKVAEQMDLVIGRSPISVIAAAIYLASQASETKLTPKEIGLEVKIADVTIRQAYKLLYERAEDLFPKDFKFATPIDQLPLP